MSFLSKFFSKFKSSSDADKVAAAADKQVAEEAISALSILGFQPAAVRKVIGNILKAIEDAKAGKAPANGYQRKDWEIVINNALNVGVAFIPVTDKEFQKDVLDFVTKYKSKTLVDFALAAQRAVNERDK